LRECELLGKLGIVVPEESFLLITTTERTRAVEPECEPPREVGAVPALLRAPYETLKQKLRVRKVAPAAERSKAVAEPVPAECIEMTRNAPSQGHGVVTPKDKVAPEAAHQPSLRSTSAAREMHALSYRGLAPAKQGEACVSPAQEAKLSLWHAP
jgi:hypothetical protein